MENLLFRRTAPILNRRFTPSSQPDRGRQMPLLPLLRRHLSDAPGPPLSQMKLTLKTFLEDSESENRRYYPLVPLESCFIAAKQQVGQNSFVFVKERPVTEASDTNSVNGDNSPGLWPDYKVS